MLELWHWIKLKEKCTRCKSAPPYYVVGVDKYWQWRGLFIMGSAENTQVSGVDPLPLTF